MQNQRRTAVLHIEAFSHPADKDNRKFQSLALMNTHDPHRIRLLPADAHLAEVNLIPAQFLDIADKVKQSAVARRLEFDRFLHQHIEIRLALLSARHGCGEMSVSRLL